MARHTLLLELAYDGNAFHGVALQSGLATVGAVLEEHLCSVFGLRPNALTFAARTDRGVSAEQNFATCWFRGITPTEDALRQVQRQWEALRVVSARWVPRHVHARNTTCEKHYRYIIQTRCSLAEIPRYDAPRTRPENAARDAPNGVWKVVPPLNLEAMRRAARDLEGSHDFTAFRALSCGGKDPHKTLSEVSVAADDDRILIDVRGRAFLRKMVRIIVGTLAEVGAGFRPADSMPLLLEGRNRDLSGMTAPASGLRLVSVKLFE